MKTNRSASLLLSALGLAVLSTVGCAQREKTTAETSITPPHLAPSGTMPTAAAPDWAGMKDCSYDMRAGFFTGLDRMQATVDSQMGMLAAKRATMKSTTDTKDWDFAMKEMNDAQSYLKSTRDTLGKADADTWNQAKDKVGQAWLRTQDAYTKVMATTTG